MVTYSRAALGAGDVRSLIKPSAVSHQLTAVSRKPSDLRPLNGPSPLRVQTDAQGRIVAVWRHGRLTPRSIAAVQDCWRIDDEWWREHPVSRMYYAVVLDDGTLLSMYHDLVGDSWFEQQS